MRVASVVVSGIKKRRDFLAIREGKKASSPGFLMVSRKNPENGDSARFGLTVTKKLGGAVKRNRIRRRLRAAAKAVFPKHSSPGEDYVMIARAAAYDRSYAVLLDDMKRALLRLSRAPK